MMEGFADLLTDAFSEGSVPSFSTGDLDFESFCFDERSEEEQNKNPKTENDEARLQEASAEGAALLEGPLADALNSDENAYKEQTDEENDEEGLNRVRFSNETPEDDECPSSDGEEERSYFCSGRDGEEEAECQEEDEDTLKLIYKTVDGILEDEDSEILEDVDELQVSNNLQEEAHSDEEENGCRNENIAESPESEEEQEVDPDSSESDYEGVKTEEEEKEKPGPADPADSGLEFSCISLQNLQDLISEVDGEVYEEKMSDFTGEEHQEAGESFADYPSDFSSGEYGRNAATARSASPRLREEEGLQRAVTESHESEEEGSGKEEEFLFSRDIEVNVEKMMMSLDEAAGDEVEGKTEHLLRGTSFDDEEKTSESDSYSSSDDEEPLRRSSDVFSDKSRTRFLEHNTNLENIRSLGASGSDDSSFGRDRYDPAEFLSSGLGELETKTFLYEFFLSGEDTDGTESPNSGGNQCPDQDVNSYSVVQKKDSIPASPFVQGSIDDSFFFNTEPKDFTDDGQQEEEEEEEEEEDEYEERRNFEQMKQRIEAFKRFYDNSDDENGREERQIKVQFCADPLSQVNYYETDSDRDSVSSSSDREEDLSSAEQSDDKEEDLNPAEQSEDTEEDLNPAEQSEDTEEDLNPAEQSEDTEEDLNPAEQSEDTEEDLNPAEQSEDKEEDLNYAEQSENKEEDLNSGEQFEDSSSAEQSDEPQEPEEDLDIKPVFGPPIVQQHQSPADVVDTQTCTPTRKAFSTLKMIVTLGVLTATGLMMFCLATDQPDWLRPFFFF
ncbi:glutamic acid-rich protein isoform X2 [Xiphophorus couchianus]|uniref:glutamic acid-rich protein isoform X2 n=1 Tax=Xiphophorus couchianus TaxID=32473 RepID=UPI00101697F8|nr:glutamic acid-rich protein-like isoform X2 [Xiphophorus couchianus]